MELREKIKQEQLKLLRRCANDWNLFAKAVLSANLDQEQKDVLTSFQYNKMTSVASGTARGKDFVAAVAALCFLYLTPQWDSKGNLIANTKVALSAPTGRQVEIIMLPEIARLHSNMIKNGFGWLSGKLNAKGIKTEAEEWFLVGFKADEHNHEAWTGFHAVNTAFIITEASGIPDSIFTAIEGNLQGNSRLLLVFNNNNGLGYAAESQYSPRFHAFRLNSLNAPNVVQKKMIIPGQADYEWILDKVQTWCFPISQEDFSEIENDFEFEGSLYRPNDVFRVKVLGLAPKVSSDILVPIDWIIQANNRWKEFKAAGGHPNKELLRLGVDVAGMGRDSTCYCFRFDNYVDHFDKNNSGGVADHMNVAGKVKSALQAHSAPRNKRYAMALIDTIGEGAGVYSRLKEQAMEDVHSVKFSSSAKDKYDRPFKDVTGVYELVNMRDYCHWAVRDWLNPLNKTGAMLPPDQELAEELSKVMWAFQSDGRVKLEKKEDLKERIKRSPDKADALALTFAPMITPQQTERHRQTLARISNWLP